MSDELDELLNDDEATPEPEVQVTEAPETAESVTGEDTPAAEPEAAEPPSAEAAPEHATNVPLPALVAERQARQEAERELNELRRQIEASQAEAPARPDVFEDPDGAFGHLEAQIEQALAAQRIEMSRMVLATSKTDFADREAEFMALAKDNPTLVTQMLASDNPALFAYDTARKAAEWAAIQDVDKWKEERRAEIAAEERAKLEAEFKADGERKAAIANAAGIPSLATVPGAGNRSDIPEDDDLRELLDNR